MLFSDNEIVQDAKPCLIETKIIENGDSSVEGDQNCSPIDDSPKQNGVSSAQNESHAENEKVNNASPQETVFCSQNLVERVLSNEVLSESSNEEVEENFCLLQNIEKPIHYTDVSFTISTNVPFDSPKETIYEMQNGVGECSDSAQYGFTRDIEQLAEHQDNDIRRLREWLLNGAPNKDEKNFDAEEPTSLTYAKIVKELTNNNESESEDRSQESSTEEVNVVTIDCQNVDSNDLQASSCQKESTETFVNTYEVDKQILFTLNYAELSENTETSAVVNEAVFKSYAINETFVHNSYSASIESYGEAASCDNANNEDVKSVEENSEVFVNTCEINNDKQ